MNNLNREYIWLPPGREKEGLHASMKVCDPIPFARDSKPIRLWVLHCFRNNAIQPPEKMKLEHGVSGVLEDIGHDWHVRQDHLIYRGAFSDGGVWLAIEFEGKTEQ